MTARTPQQRLDRLAAELTTRGLQEQHVFVREAVALATWRGRRVLGEGCSVLLSGHPADAFRSNCTRCVVATDRSLGGAPSSAMPLYGQGAPITDVSAATGRAWEQVGSYGDIVRRVTAAGDGARGIVFSARPDVGHVFNVINDGGTVLFLDGQTGKVATRENFHSLGFMPHPPVRRSGVLSVEQTRDIAERWTQENQAEAGLALALQPAAERMVRDWCVVWIWNSARFVQSGDFDSVIPGNRPLVVRRDDGRILRLPTGRAPDKALEDLERELVSPPTDHDFVDVLRRDPTDVSVDLAKGHGRGVRDVGCL